MGHSSSADSWVSCEGREHDDCGFGEESHEIDLFSYKLLCQRAVSRLDTCVLHKHIAPKDSQVLWKGINCADNALAKPIILNLASHVIAGSSKQDGQG